MLSKRIASLLVAWAAIGSGPSFGLGLGEITLQSALNEPLKAQIRLRGVGDLGPEQIIVRLAPSADFERSGIERLYSLTEMQFEVKLDRSGDGEVYLRTDQPVREPYLDFLLEVRWPSGRVLREYTVLLDLPTYSAASAPPADVSAPRVPARPSVTPRSDGGGAWSSGSSYDVKPGDTLWGIARRSRADGVSVQQMLEALHRENPEAFAGGDINRLRAGAVLRIPGELSSGPSAPVSADQSASAPSSESSTAASTESGAARADTDQAYLRLAGDKESDQSGSVGGEPGAAGGGGSTDDLAAVQENLSAKERENAELASRVKALEEQVKTYQRVVDLKSEGMADAQSAAATEAPAPEPAPAPRTPPPAPVEETGLLQSLLDNGLMIAAAVLVALIGTLALLFIRQRRLQATYAPLPEANQKFRPASRAIDPELPSAPEPEAVATRRAEPPAEATPPEPPQPAAVQPASIPPAAMAPSTAVPKGFDLSKLAAPAPPEETSDPLAEADMLVAYGRHPRAMEVLRKAIADNPEAIPLRLKLMEILVGRDEQGEFLAEYDRILALGSDDDVEAARALCIESGRRQWLAELDAPEGIQSTETLSPPAAPTLSRSLTAIEEEPPPELSSIDLELHSVEPSPVPDDLGLDLDFDPDGLEPLAASPAETEDALPGLDDADFGELELDIGVPAEAPASPALSPLDDLAVELGDAIGMEEDAPIAEAGGHDETGILDFDITEPLEESSPAAASEDVAPTPEEAADDLRDLELLAGTDEVETRIELARAFIEMGDAEGARDILEEVLAEGSEAQREVAAALLDTLKTG